MSKLSTALCGSNANMDLTGGSGLATMVGEEGGISGEKKTTLLLAEIRNSTFHQKEMEDIGGMTK